MNTTEPNIDFNNEPEPVTKSEPEPVTKSEPEPVTKSESEPVTKSEPEPDNESISLLMRQTTYTREECIEKLKCMSIEEIIKQYLGVIKKDISTGTTNQNIFKVIRDFF